MLSRGAALCRGAYVLSRSTQRSERTCLRQLSTYEDQAWCTQQGPALRKKGDGSKLKDVPTPPPRPSPVGADSTEVRLPRISTFWVTVAGVGGLSWWVFGGEAPAAQDKLTRVENKAATIPVVYSAAAYQGNKQSEDRYEVRQTAEGDVVCSVFDGHGGWGAAAYVSATLTQSLENELTNHSSDTPEEVKSALVRAFERTDRTLMHYVYFWVMMGFASLARIGACAITAFIRGRDLYIANAGDCRAVLGRRQADGRMIAEALSDDHNARMPKEQEMLRAAHPGEPDIIVCRDPTLCYVKGKSQATRTLGDAYLKCAEFNGRAGGRGAARRYIPPPYTPPYSTATPEVTHVALDKSELPGAEFVVIASDGIWDILTNQQVVDIVARAVSEQRPEEASDMLIDTALAIKAHEFGLTVEQLRSFPPGQERRLRHDDMTVVVAFLDRERLPSELTGKSEGSKLTRLESSSKHNRAV